MWQRQPTVASLGWPQQPTTKKMLRFNLTFQDSTKKFFFSKQQNKAEFKNLDDSKVLSGDLTDFPGLSTSAVSMTCTASTTSMASMTSPASFHQKHY